MRAAGGASGLVMISRQRLNRPGRVRARQFDHGQVEQTLAAFRHPIPADLWVELKLIAR